MAWQFNTKGLGGAIGEGIMEGNKYRDSRDDRAEDVRIKKAGDLARLKEIALKDFKGYRDVELDDEGLFKGFNENPSAKERNRPILENLAPQFYEKKIQESQPFKVLPQNDIPTDDLTARMNAETRRRAAAGDMRPVTMADVAGPSAIAPTAQVPAATFSPASPVPLLKDPKHDIEKEKLLYKATGEAIKAKGAAADADAIKSIQKDVVPGAGPNGENVQFAARTEQNFPEGAVVAANVQEEKPEIKDVFNPTPEMMADIQNRVTSAPQRDADVLVPNATIPATIRAELGLQETGQTPSSVFKALLDYKKPTAAALKAEAALSPRLYELADKVASGELSYGQAMGQFQVEEGRQVNPREEKIFNQSRTTWNAKQNRDAAIAAKPNYVGGTKLSPAQQKADEVFGKDYADYYASGGRASVEKDLDSIRSIPERLRKLNVPGGRYTGLLPKGARDIVAPKLSEVQEDFELTVQKTLRKILGTQFTEREGEAFFKRSFNPSLPIRTNIARVEKAIKELESMADDKEDAAKYYEQNGTLAGFKPKRRASAVQPVSRDEKNINAVKRDVGKNPSIIRSVMAKASQKMKEIDGMGITLEEKAALKKQVADRFEEVTGIPWGRKDGTSVP